MKHLLILLVAIILIANACKPDDTNQPSNTTLDATKMLVLNEGNFMWGNASISLYDLNKDSILFDDIYQNKNNEALGDVLQSATFIDDKIYLVVNNSGKIVVVDKHTLKKVNEVSGLGSPRAIVDGLNGYLYVSDLYANEIKVLNKTDLSIDKHIAINGWTEKLVVYNNRLYVSNVTSKYIYIINTSNNILIDSVNIGYGTNGMLLDNNHKLWITTIGKSDEAILPNISRFTINTSSLSLDVKLDLSSNSASFLCSNKTKEKIYYRIGESIYTMNSTASSLPTSSLFTKSGAIIYGLGIEPNTGDIFISDAMDYVQKSTIYRYSADGTQLKSSKKAGIISNGFLWGE